MKVLRLLPGAPQRESDGSGTLPVTYFVNGAGLTDANLLEAEDDDTGLTLPQEGEEDPNNPGYVVDTISPDFTGANANGLTALVSYTFKKSTFGSTTPPEDTPIGYEIDFRTEEVATNTDIDGNPILNAGGDPFNGTFTTDDEILVIRIYRREATYDISLGAAIRGRVNGEACSVLGHAVEARQCKCVSYRPLKRLTLGSSDPVDVEYVFEVRRGFWPWDHHAANLGCTGTATAVLGQSFGPLVSKLGVDPIEEPVMLKADGIPINATAYKVLIGKTERKDPEATLFSPVGMTFRGNGTGTNGLTGATAIEVVAKAKDEADFVDLLPDYFT